MEYLGSCMPMEYLGCCQLRGSEKELHKVRAPLSIVSKSLMSWSHVAFQLVLADLQCVASKSYMINDTPFLVQQLLS